MIKAIAVDDEPLALVVVEAFCQRMDFIDLRSTFTEPAEAIKYLSGNQVDLIFLDVKMPAMSGLEFARHIDEEVMVIFTTAYIEYAVEGFNLNAIDYLLKPFAFERFEQATIKARNLFEYRTNSGTNEPSYILLRVDYSLRKVYIDNMLYIEGLDNNLRIVLKDGDPIIIRMSMKAMEEKLPADAFMRVHRSFIIPIQSVERYKDKILYAGNRTFPVGRSFLQQVEQVFKK